MGKSNPTYRNLLDKFCDELEPFRRAAYRERQPAFDRVIEHAHRHAAAAGYVNYPDPEKLALFSICVGLQEEILELRREVGLEVDVPYGKGIQGFEA